ncbi:MAG: hypothetical protein F4Y94_01015, partial [Chloroflexi bacterium]|nr:hypothetical protein [Chloroflexota bacterium]
PRLMPPGVARGLVLSGDVFDANRARAWGLVNEVVPAGRLDERALQAATDLAARDTAALTAAARAIRRGLDLPLTDAIALDAAAALTG